MSSLLSIYAKLRDLPVNQIFESKPLIYDLNEAAFALLERSEPVELVSLVPGKTYRSFRMGDVITRPFNSNLFRDLPPDCLEGELDEKVIYTLAMAPCLAFDLTNNMDRKTPATYFERLVGCLMSRLLNTCPQRKQNIGGDASIRMTADYLFHTNGIGIHVPVKLSTRERASQAWTHQNLLNQHYGRGIYRGVMVLLGETKLDRNTHKVTEICVPKQWRAYQRYQAEMHKIYYLDPPEKYLSMNDEFPGLVQKFHTIQSSEILN